MIFGSILETPQVSWGKITIYQKKIIIAWDFRQKKYKNFVKK